MGWGGRQEEWPPCVLEKVRDVFFQKVRTAYDKEM